jgi:ubiquinone/menaquinone biosynthesis C-methylase UbiE
MTTPLHTANFAHPPRNVGALQIEPGMIVADFGAGSGAYVLAIAERLAHAGHVYAIDVQQDLLRRIKNESHKRGYNNVEIVWSDLERTYGSKIASDHVHRVLISNLLFQVDDKAVLMAEAYRILMPCGLLGVVDWSESFGGMGPHKKAVVKKEAAMKFAETAGFELVREFEAGAHHYGLIFKKPATV